MGKVLWHATMSLDGFIAGPGDDMDWLFRYAGPNPEIDQVIASVGAILAGRRSYDVGARAGSEPFGGAWSGPQIVLTHRPPEAATSSNLTFLAGDIRKAVSTSRAAAGDKDVVVFGANIAKQCIEAGLLDEILVHVAPILLGAGVRLFARGGAGEEPVDLEPISVSQAGPIMNLRFRVI